MATIGENRARGGGFSRLLAFLLILAALLLGAFAVAVRLDGGRELVREWATRKAGFELDLDAARIALPYVLVLENVRSRDTAPDGRPLFHAREVQLVPGIPDPAGLRIEGGELTLLRKADGTWQPAAAAWLGGVPEGGIAGLSRELRRVGLRGKTALREMAVRWLDADGSERAGCRALTLRVAPVRLPGRKMTHVYLRAVETVEAGGVRTGEAELEWLTGTDHPFLGLHRRILPPEVGADGFWRAESEVPEPVPASAESAEPEPQPVETGAGESGL